METITPYSCFCFKKTISTLLPNDTLLALEVLPPIFSFPHSSKASNPHHTTNASALPSALLIICATLCWCISFSFPSHLSSNHLSHFCTVSSHPAWIHTFSQSAASNSVTHHRLSASILPFDLIFLVKSLIIVILCCCFISSTSVDTSCLLCRRCQLFL